MIRSKHASVSYGFVYAATAVALAGACSSDNNTPAVTNPEGGVGGTAGSGGRHTGGAAGRAGAGGADASLGGTGGTHAGGTAGSGGTAGGGTAGAGGTAGKAGAGGKADAGPEAGTAVSIVMTNLTSDQGPGVAPNGDTHLVNAWGLAVDPDEAAFWVADNGKGVASVYDPTGASLPIRVTIGVPGDAGATSKPTGEVYNESTSFMGDTFIWATEDGAIAGWQVGSFANGRVDSTATGAIYKGLTIADVAGAKVLLATDFHNGKIDMFSATYATASTAGRFTDASVPTGFAPFNVAFMGGKVYVTYAKQDPNKEDDVKGPGLGYVSVFQPDGTFVKTLVAKGDLNAPWGLAMAPSSWGSLAGSLLVGNFGDGHIHGYDPNSGALRGEVSEGFGQPIVIDGLWALEPGPNNKPDGGADLSQTVFFTAGPADEAHGLFGKLDVKK